MFVKSFIFVLKSSNIMKGISFRVVQKRRYIGMDYKKLIVELLDKADERKLRLIYFYVKALLHL